MGLSLPICLIIACGVFATSILSGILGMAGGMVLMGILTWLLPSVQQAMILHSVSQFAANGSRAFIHRKHIYVRSLPFYFAGLTLMFAAFTYLALIPNKLAVFLLMGVSPYLAFLLPKSIQLNFTKPAQAFLSGLLVTGFQLTAGVSGPLLDIFFQNRALTRHETVATKAFTQATSHITKFIYFGFVVSSFSKATAGLPLWLFVAVVPLALAGSHLSKYVLDRLTDKHFYRATQTVLFITGAVYLKEAFDLYLKMRGHV